jgi:NAD(P)H-quinone oxidoreductase subunit 5
MTGDDSTTTTTVGPLDAPPRDPAQFPLAVTRFVWVLWLGSLAALAAFARNGGATAGPLAVDGLTVVLWVAVTSFSGIVHSYARRYLAGDPAVERFFGLTLAFTLAVLVLVAADALPLFVAAWLAMGLAMAGLVSHGGDDWPPAAAAGRLARRYFLASTGLVAVAAAVLAWQTGATTVSGATAAADALPQPVLLTAAGALLLAAMVQSALVPFQTWLLSSMTAPTPASALMHAGFVNAGGVLLVRFAPVVAADASVLLVVAAAGAVSALAGKLLKSVQVDAKTRLGCSTVGQMGFMLLQVGLGFFAAAVAHLVLHGCYKAYLFLSVGEEVDHTAPADTTPESAGTGPVRAAATVLTGLAGGAIFAAVTGKGLHADAGLLLAGLVVLTTMHATRAALRSTTVPATYRYAAAPLVFLPSVAVYALTYSGVEGLLAGSPVAAVPADLTVVHAVLAAAFLAAYAAIETGAYRVSDRLYVRLVNATQPPTDTLLSPTEDHDEH